jgi:hypothetical protein
LRLYSYVVARDFGFAPNPFYQVCTLATCKPIIRRVAKEGDWIVGTGSAERGRRGFLVYAMRVTERRTFEEYWSDARFLSKRPDLNQGKMQAFGDNIYSRDGAGNWLQANSHHSCDDGSANPRNIANDTQTDRVLIGTEYVYWGGSGPEIPELFRNFDSHDVCALRGHKCKFPPELVEQFVAWIREQGAGYMGKPLDWVRTP